MKTVKVVTSLNVEEMQVVDLRQKLQYLLPTNTIPVTPTHAVVPDKDITISYRLAKAHKLHIRDYSNNDQDEEFNYKSIYIAWDKDVQDLLKMPFDALMDQVERQSNFICDLRSDKNKLSGELFWLRNMNRWEIIKAVFTGIPK